MSIFDKFFGAPKERQEKRLVKEIIKNVSENTLRVRVPLGAIAKAVIHAAHTCSQNTKPMIRVTGNQAKIKAEMSVLYEFIYFFLHMTNRAAHPQLTEQQFEKLHEYLGDMVVPVAVDSFVGHWPEDMKEKIRSEFIDNLNRAELEYSAAKSLFSRDQPFSDDSLLGKLAIHMAENCGSPGNPEIMMPVITGAMDALEEAKFDQLISDVAKVL